MSTVIHPPISPRPASPAEAQPAGPAGEPRSRWRRLVVGGSRDPAWSRPGLLAVVALAAVLIGWGLTRSGMSNEYYAAAVKSGTVSWKA